MKLFKHENFKNWAFIILPILAYIILLSFASILRYQSFHASAFDMGIETQSIWNTSQGRLLEDSINLGFPVPRFWVAHWEFIFIPVAALFKIFPSPIMLLILQTIFLAIGAIPVYWLAKDKLKNQFVAFCFACAYLLYPAMQNANLVDIHGITFVTPMLLFAFYFLQAKKPKKFVLFAFLSLMCREDAALILFMFGLYAIFILKEKKLGATVSVTSMLWFLIFFKRAAIRSAIGLPPIIVYEGVPSHWDHLQVVFDNPLYLIGHLAKKYNISYFINLFAPVGFLSLFSPFTIILAAPTFAINLLSDYFYAHDIQHQYTATITPFVFISAIYGAENIIKFIRSKTSISQKDKSGQNKALLYGISITVIILSVTFFLNKSNVFKLKNWKVTEHHRTVEKVISQIPGDASLCSFVYLAPHAAKRRELFVFPQHKDKADFVLYDFKAPKIRLWTRPGFKLFPYPPLNPYIKEVLLNEDYGISSYEDGVILFKKGGDYEAGIRKLAISQSDEIENSVPKIITDEVLFAGHSRHNGSRMWFYSPDSGMVRKKIIHFTAYWKTSSSKLGNVEFTFNIHNADSSYTFSNTPVFGLYPVSEWQSGEIIRDEVFWQLPPEFKSGEYAVSVALSDEDENTASVHLFDMEIINTD